MTDDVELEIPPHAALLDVVRTVIATTAGIDPLLPEQRVADLRLAVSEACANAIHAHQRAHTTEMVQVRCSVDDKRVTVEIQDHGEGSTPRPSPLPAATDPARLQHERGLGIPLMRALADEIDIRAVDDGTIVSLVLNLPEV